MQLLTSYLLPPGCCTFCSSTELPVVDMEVDDDALTVLDVAVELRGSVYLCVNCANEVVQVIGGLPATATNILKNRLLEVFEERDRLVEQLALSNAALDAMTAAGRNPATPEVANV